VQDKAMAMLHSIWLISGPSLEGVAWFLASVRSLTTDMGVEKALCDLPNPLASFAAYMGLRCPPHLEELTHLFPMAVFIPGWNHLINNLLRESFSSLRCWPAMLERLRAFCTFFKVSDYRGVWQRHLAGKGIDGAVLGNFSAGFAKWRWNTICDVLTQVNRLADLCTQHFDASLWRKLQDQRHLSTVEACCQDPYFWTWVSVFQSIAKLVDEARVWGCLCSCHQEELLNGKSIACNRKSRRLHEAGPYIKVWVRRLLDKANTLTLQDCNGMESVLADAEFALRRVAGLALQKFDFLNMLPWSLARADHPEHAKACLEQWGSVPEDAHHRVTRHLMKKHRSAIARVASGYPASPELQDLALSSVYMFIIMLMPIILLSLPLPHFGHILYQYQCVPVSFCISSTVYLHLYQYQLCISSFIGSHSAPLASLAHTHTLY